MNLEPMPSESPAIFMNNQWVMGTNSSWQKRDPGTGTLLWSGREPSFEQINQAITQAKLAQPTWASLTYSQRSECLQRFKSCLIDQQTLLTQTISSETGKPLWDSRTEVQAMINKVEISFQAFQQRTPNTQHQLADAILKVEHRPHGTVVVLGPFNFPGHLPHGHIIPALLAGNCVIFKPSEKTPLTAQRLAQCWQTAELPAGVFSLVQGGMETAKTLCLAEAINGIFFTGGWQTGEALKKDLANSNHKILALELGGNNPLMVADPFNEELAVEHIIHSAFLSTGQRCTCARRLLIPDTPSGESLLQKLLAKTATLRIGHYNDKDEPFMGPMISAQAVQQLLDKQSSWIRQGALPLLPCRVLDRGEAFVSAGILDVTPIAPELREDVEVFGPLLRVIRYPHLEAGIAEAGRTQFGLAAALICEDSATFARFKNQLQAGVINWNRPTTGASSLAPFGGLKASGNHRPSAFYAADYCAYPVASMEAESLKKLPQVPGL